MSTKPTGPRPESSGGRVVLLMLVGLALLFGGAYAAAWWFAADKLPIGTTIAGVEVGGQTPVDARRSLVEGLGGRDREPIEVSVASTAPVPVDPADAGLSVDFAASVDDAGGGDRSWAPSRLWAHYTGGDDLDPVVTVDEAALDAAVTALAADAGTPPVDGGISFVRGAVKITPPAEGDGIDPETARAALQSAYLQADPRVDLALTTLAPDIDQADVQKALDEFANPAVSGAVTLRFGSSPVRLQPQQYARFLSMRPVDGVLEPRLDAAGLVGLVGDRTVDEGAPVDATVALVDGKPKVVPGKPGVTFDGKAISSTFLDVVVKDLGKRQLKVKATGAAPDFTTKDARKLRIRRKVSSFTTYYPYAEYRNINIGRAAELVDGTVLKPGETFSLNGTVGERTRENGFTEGFIISNGIFKEDLGGGVSQMATTTFNAMFFAGLEDVEHKPHSFYIDRYPVGREATVAWGSVDLRFRNDTPYGVLVEAKVTPATASSSGVVTVSMWSTKVWDITTTASDRYNLTSPATRTLTTAECYPNTGYGGFDIDVFRYFRKPGQSALDHQEKFHTTYTPSDTVICKKPEPLPTPPPTTTGQ